MMTLFSKLDGDILLILLSLRSPLMLKVLSLGTLVAGMAIKSWATELKTVEYSLDFS
jgi:hypothetical protein